MNSRVYYGEYSLADWIDMLLKNNIEIPQYQRYFVWDRNSVIDLIKAFKDNRYVPPITICKSIGSDKKEHNYIVDGQQRLSAIFMYKFDFYYNSKIKNEVDFSEENITENYKEWTIDNVIRNKQYDVSKTIIDEISKENSPYEYLLKKDEEYLRFDKEDLFENKYLGFSYIILENTKDINEHQRFYAQIFNDINTMGISLTPIESRKAYYFINEKYAKLFNISFGNIDFVRYLAILSEYHKSIQNNNNNGKIAKNTNTTRKLENYIIEYIISMSENESERFVKIEEIFSDDNYEELNEIKNLKDCLKDKYYKFDEKSSIIDKDIKLFGLIYNILFLHKEFKNQDSIKNELNTYIESEHKNEKITKSPNSNKNLNERLIKSIAIYNKHINNYYE